jgi:hypothetical protein
VSVCSQIFVACNWHAKYIIEQQKGINNICFYSTKKIHASDQHHRHMLGASFTKSRNQLNDVLGTRPVGLAPHHTPQDHIQILTTSHYIWANHFPSLLGIISITTLLSKQHIDAIVTE